MISILIPTFGNFQRCKKLITSIQRYEKGPYHIIVINDNPRPLPAQVKAKDKSWTVLGNLTNLGFAKSVNKGLAHAKGDILLLCNDDIVWTNPILAKIEAEFAQDKELGILGALLKYPNVRGITRRETGIQHAGVYWDRKRMSFLHVKSNPKTKYFIAVTGALFAISRTLYSKLGGLDEKYFLACEDTQYCLDAWRNGFKVKFSKDIVAIHEEGATRGRTDQQKATHKEWTAKEHDGIRHFQKSWDLKELAALQKRIRKLNGEPPIKIEVGSGYNPHPGYKHLDIRAGLPQLDYVCDFVKDSLPFEDGSVEEILANHVIEHIPFRKLPFVLSEWSRVLEDGGKLTLRTPNLRFICQMYLNSETTPEWPDDEKYITANLSERVTPAWWANLKLFSGQDYDANFHHICFDFNMLEGLLKRYGFGEVYQDKFDREFSPGELQVTAYKGQDEAGVADTYRGRKVTVQTIMPTKEFWAKEKELNPFTKPVIFEKKEKSCLLIRTVAMGDVILTTPIIERLSKEYPIIDVATHYPQIFDLNPHVRSKFQLDRDKLETVSKYYDRVIDLDLAYEKRPKMHIIDAYSLEAFSNVAAEYLEIKLYYTPIAPPRNYIVLHCAKSWENRTWHKDSWGRVAAALRDNGESLVAVGGRSDICPINVLVKDVRDQEDFWQLVETIAQAKLFIGMDSGPLHIAQAVNTPAIGIFTCANAKYRVTKNIWTVEPNIDCYGCLHDAPPPVTHIGCRRGDFKCLDLITPSKVLEAYEQFRRETARGDIVIEDRSAT